MKALFRLFTVMVMVVMLANTAHAITDGAKCDKIKSVAAGKLFAKVMSCYTKYFGDNTFDYTSCTNVAHDKC